MRNGTALLLALSGLSSLGGCADSSMAMGDIGVTQGGSQDIRLARELIEAGQIPRHDHFTAEGLFSEHDLPITGEGCDAVLCPRAAAARIDPVDGSGSQLLVQLGFGTKYESETFSRKPLNLAVALDVSGSMSGGKLDAAKVALERLVAQLDDGDQLALVTFSDRAKLLAPMLRVIDGLGTEGGTNLEAGLERAAGEVGPDAALPGVESRVMLFTDAQPNIGATDIHSFTGMTRYYAEAGIGLSLFGVGLDMGSDIATEVTRTRGGNYFFLSDNDAIEQVFDDEFDFMVTPVAFDLQVNVEAASGFSFDRPWAAPLDEADVGIEFGASTLFLSARDGGMGVSLLADGGVEAAEGGDVVTFDLSYEDGETGALATESLAVGFDGGVAYETEHISADDVGVLKMGVLIDGVLALEASADFCDGVLDPKDAVDRIAEAQARLHDVAAMLEDDDLQSFSDLLGVLGDGTPAQIRPALDRRVGGLLRCGGFCSSPRSLQAGAAPGSPVRPATAARPARAAASVSRACARATRARSTTTAAPIRPAAASLASRPACRPARPTTSALASNSAWLSRPGATTTQRRRTSAFRTS